jgi:hypothetical protein
MLQLAEFNNKDYKLPDKVLNYISEYRENSNPEFVIIYVYRDHRNTDKVFILNFGKRIVITSNTGEKILEFLPQEFNYYLKEKKEPVLNAVYGNSYFIAKIKFNKEENGGIYEKEII